MFIYQFNRLIRSRILWGAFAVVVALAFVGVPVATHFENRNQQGPVMGKIDGEKIRRQDFDKVRFFMEALELGPEHDLSSEEIEQRVWRRLAAVKMARNLDLDATDAEIAAVIRNDPAFQHENRFNSELYRTLLMRELRIQPAEYERFTYDRICLRKLSDLLEAAAWVPPDVVQHQIRNMTDRFSLEYTWISNRFATANMPVPRDAVYEYYATNRESFRLPARRSVVYARFPVSRHLDAVRVEDDEIREYYENMAHRFMRPGTNGVDETIPLEEVSEEITAELRHEKARYEAMAAAMELLERLDRDSRDNALQERAPQAGAGVHTSELFAAGQSLPEVDAGEEFTETAFNLDPSRQTFRFSDIVMGASNAYILALHSNVPPSIQEFEEAFPMARQAVVEEARRDAFDGFLDTVYSNVAAAVTENDVAFSNAVVRAGLPAPTNLTFTAIEAFQSATPYAATLAQAVSDAEPGQLLEPRPVEDGALLIFVKDRERGDSLSAEMLRGDIRRQIQRYRSAPLMEAWMRWNFERIAEVDTPPVPGETEAALEELPDGAY